MKKFTAILYLLILSALTSAFTFPDNLPEWKKVNKYSPVKLFFQKTKLVDFRKNYPDAKTFEYDKSVTIINAKPLNPDVYKNINVGFKDGVLDWIEFDFAKNISMKDITNVYGPPDVVNTEYNPELDYYNYGRFNVSTDKKHKTAKSISIFAVEQQEKIVNSIQQGVFTSDHRSFFSVFPLLTPGLYAEQDFIKRYPLLLPYTEENNDTATTYTLLEELGDAKGFYKQAVLRFDNGLLSWISLTPVDNRLSSFVTRVKDRYKVEKADDTSDFYVYDSFVLVVDKKNKTINRIGVINFDKRI